ncbi:DUF4199 domain-containing protein [Flavobacterium nitrogenifigens]|uniref:DUF4199 domain-containing protein n=1 Tax=Flavobacterium nitrogenifigens TaxID=1617283 RepID=UPI0031A78F7D
MRKIILTYGLIGGAVVALFMVCSTSLAHGGSFEHSMFLGYTGMLIANAFVFLGVKNYRDNQNDGVITFGKAFKIGMFISLIAATVYVGVWLVEYYCFMPDFMDKYASAMQKTWQKENLPLAEIKAKTEEMKMYMELYKSPIWVILLTYMEILVPIGLLVPVISALILKRQVKPAIN